MLLLLLFPLLQLLQDHQLLSSTLRSELRHHGADAAEPSSGLMPGDAKHS